MANSEEQDLRAFLASLLQARADHAPFAADESLVISGRLDSIDVLQIVNFLESRFGVDFSRRGLDPAEVSSVSGLQVLLAEHRRNVAS